MCRPKISNIRKACDKAGNATGVRSKVRIAAVNDVSTVPAPDVDTYVISSDIVMNPDVLGDATNQAGVFNEWEFSEIGSTYNFEPEGEEEDGFGTHVLTVFLPKMTAAKNLILDEAKGGKEFIVQFNDRNETPWLMGNTTVGATVTATPGTDINSRNGYNVVIRFRSAANLYEYTGALSIAADA